MQSLLQEPCISGLLGRENRVSKAKKKAGVFFFCTHHSWRQQQCHNNINSVGEVQVSEALRGEVHRGASKGTSVEEQMVLLVVANTSLPVGASL